MLGLLLNSLRPHFRLPTPTLLDAVAYLVRYGHLGAVDGLESLPSAQLEAVHAAARDLQRLAGLEPTGELCPATLRVMSWPRCGVQARMASKEARWRKNRLTYWVESYVGGISQADQDELIRLAWSSWEAAADVKLTKVGGRGQADMVISTGRGASAGFDGPQGTLAWAQLPPGNDSQLLMRFDLDERWLRDSTAPGILFRNVACHEFGHLLGLDHSRVQGALMAPFYAAGVDRPQASDDVTRIQALYGRPAQQPPSPPTPTPAAGVVTVDLGARTVTLPAGWTSRAA